MHLRSQWWLSASNAAFLTSGLEVATFLPYLIVRPEPGDTGLAEALAAILAAILLLMIGVALQATAMWGVTRQQEWIAPTATRISRWGILAYVVVSAAIILWQVFTRFGPPPWGTPPWIYHVPVLVKSLSFGALALNSAYEMRSLLQRWACGALAIGCVFGCLSVLSRIMGSPVTDLSPSFPAIHVAIRAGMWLAVGAWLRTASLDHVTVAH